jgi:L-Ala-D/L-Glu epimerase
MKRKSSALGIRYQPVELEMRHVFTISGASRKTSPTVLVAIDFAGMTGYGEASIPPYLGETTESVIRFLKKLDLIQFRSPLQSAEIIEYVMNLVPGNFAAKASVDIALNDLAGKIRGEPWFSTMKINPQNTPYTSFTLGIDTVSVISKKIDEASPYRYIKVKLGSDKDKETITFINSHTSRPLIVDVNQGWDDKYQALDMICWLAERGVIMVEQPMPAERVEDIAWLTRNSPLPVFADEAVQTINDLDNIAGVYDGINIKLMKCGGMNAGLDMIREARKRGLSVMIGCMTETSCAISAAGHLSPLCDMADLDGNLLITNDPFSGVLIEEGKIILNHRPGIGVSLRQGKFPVFPDKGGHKPGKASGT